MVSDKFGFTALYTEASLNRLEVTKILLKYKPKLLKNIGNETAFDDTKRKKNEEIVQSITKTHYNM